MARWLLRRERRVLGRLEGVSGVPQIQVDFGPNSLLMNLLPGQPLSEEAFREDPRGLANCLRSRIEAIHERGVFHLDLRQRQNILISGPAEAQLVDFGASMAPRRLGRWLWGSLLAWVDHQAVLKYLARHAPEELTLDEARSLSRALRWRRMWVFSPHKDRGERAAARARIRKG
jgi:serine/threonine protein kinase